MKQRDSQGNESRNAWISLGMVLLAMTATTIYSLVDQTPWNGDLFFPLLIILSMVTGVSLAIRALGNWPARIALILVCAFVIVPQIARNFRPNPFPSFKDQIAEGMTIEQVKEILGEPSEIEQLVKLVKVPIDFTLRDADGNPINQDHIVKTVDGDRLLHFRIRRTVVVIRLDEKDRVLSRYEHFDLQ